MRDKITKRLRSPTALSAADNSNIKSSAYDWVVTAIFKSEYRLESHQRVRRLERSRKYSTTCNIDFLVAYEVILC